MHKESRLFSVFSKVFGIFSRVLPFRLGGWFFSFIALLRLFAGFFFAAGFFAYNFCKADLLEHSCNPYAHLITLLCSRHKQHKAVFFGYTIPFLANCLYFHFQLITNLNRRISWPKTASSSIVSHFSLPLIVYSILNVLQNSACRKSVICK